MKSSGTEPLAENPLHRALAVIAAYYGGCKYGVQGFEGYRKSTDLDKLVCCVLDLADRGMLDTEETNFLDLGCADGRVNVLMSYFVRRSIGIEIDPEILSEYAPRFDELRDRLAREGLPHPPENIALFQGSSLDHDVHDQVHKETGARFVDVDMFYTYITLHDLFAEEIEHRAKEGALYLVYGFNRVLPRYDGLHLLIEDVGAQGIAALYGKGVCG